ncbi:hypothetical protein ILUMI_10539 [Ignelater luminosus]|uniref:Uncharacterized protein n=1 Tax=Ignelater luminosus TaxID=2038154 RepID=A0A8K0CXX5_IGNLU|nr:hypothetical protein ILUMI_10539 [Ignelater luminosus]
MKSAIFLFIIFAHVIGFYSKPSANTSQQCHQGDSNFDDCLRKLIERGILILINEDPRLNISGADLYLVQPQVYTASVENLATGTVVVKNMKIGNAGKFRVENVKMNFDNLVLDLDLFFPKLSAKADFKINGKLFELALNTEGSLKAKATELKLHCKVQLKIVENKGTKYLVAEDVEASESISDGSVSIIVKDPEQQPIVLETGKKIKALVSSGADPYVIPQVVHNASLENFATGTVVFINMQIENAGKFKVEDAKIDFDTLILDLDVYFPKLSVKTDFKIDATLLEFPVHTQGWFKGKLTDLKVQCKVQLKIAEKEGVKYLTASDLKAHESISDASISINVKDPQQQPIADLIQNWFNGDPQQNYKLLDPIVESDGKLYYLPLIQEMLSKIQSDLILST